MIFLSQKDNKFVQEKICYFNRSFLNTRSIRDFFSKLWLFGNNRMLVRNNSGINWEERKVSTSVSHGLTINYVKWWYLVAHCVLQNINSPTWKEHRPFKTAREFDATKIIFERMLQSAWLWLVTKRTYNSYCSFIMDFNTGRVKSMS